MKSSTLAAAVLAVPSLVAVAAAPPAPDALDPVVVTATRTAVRESDTLASVTVITRDEIERAQVTDLADLLRFASGVEVARNGGPGQLASAFIRGGNSQHTLVLLDGVRINPTTQGAALQNIDVDMIERVEIVKGPRSTLYGSDAMGGVVHVITRRAAGSGASLQTRYGSYGTRDVAGSGSLGGRLGGVRLQAGQLESDGFAPHRDSTLARGHRNTTINVGGDLAIGPLTLGARGWDTRGNAEYLEDPNPFCFPCAYTGPAELDFHNRALALDAVIAPVAALESRLLLDQTLDESRITQGAFAPSHSRSERTQLRWQNVWRATDWTRLSLGLESARERTEAADLLETRDANSVYLQDELYAGAHRALLAGSLLDHDSFGTIRLWNAEYGYAFATGTRVSAGAGTGFRAPNIFERFFPFFGNPDLRPERARNYEIGVRQDFAPGHRVDVRAFRIDYRDLIAFDTGTLLAGNVARARNDGVELAWRWQPVDALALRLAGLVQDPRACTPDCASGAPLVRRAHKSAAAEITSRWHPVELSVDVLAAGPRADFDSGTFAPARLPGYAVVGMGAALDLDPRWLLRIRGENLLDKDYQTVEGYNTPGFSASVTVGYRL